MKEIEGEILGTCDIDETLLMWEVPDSYSVRTVMFKDPYTLESKKVVVNEANLRVLTNWLQRGAIIIVWSRSGKNWAKAALEALKLDHNNIHVATKPLFYIDDKPAADWMGEQVFLPVACRWGKGQ